jgi:hypothetical protein
MRAWACAALFVVAACRDKVQTRTLPDNEAGHVTVDAFEPPPVTPAGKAPVGIVVEEKCPPRCPPAAPTTLNRKPGANPIAGENARPGDANWRSGRQSSKDEVELYASVESAEAGDAVAVRVSTDSDQDVTAEVFRIDPP